MQGQWITEYPGPPKATAMLDIDQHYDRYLGSLKLAPEIGPAVVMRFGTDNLDQNQKLELVPSYVDQVGVEYSAEELAANWPELQFPTAITLTLGRTGDALKADWSTDIGGHFGGSIVPPGRGAQPSDLVPEPGIQTWEAFRDYCSDLPNERHIFRGQSRPWRIRTAFHREGRSDLYRYAIEDVSLVYGELVSRTKHLFDLKDDRHHAGFLNLLQHHGYPTPLLDWTLSPYVAAYFAYEQDRDDPDIPVRILMFDAKEWARRYRQISQLAHPSPHVSILRAYAIENERQLPQQGLSLVTNLDDPETYLAHRSEQSNHQFLRAIDLPYHQREKVLTELHRMGISAASLFPGLDGACRELRYRYFYRPRASGG